MKSIPIILLIAFINTFLYGQSSRTINIHIQTEQGLSIPSAHLTMENDQHFISTNSGNISMLSPSNSITFQISHISFIQIDTTIQIDRTLNHTIILKSNSYSIDPVTISDKLRLFEKQNWSIRDITFHDYGFLVSAVEKSKKYIYLFDKNGVQVLKSQTKFKHKKITNGLKPGHYHLMNEARGLEIMVSTDTIMFLDINPIELYDKTLHHFKYSNNRYTVSEEWALHNKKLTLSRLDNKTFEREPFHVTFDEENFIRAQSVFREILGLYYKESETDDPRSINAGFNKENVLFEKTWNGDLYDLIITDTIQEVYNYYKSIHANELAISTLAKDDKLFVLDNFHRNLKIYELGEIEISEQPREIEIPETIESGEFMNSGQENELIIASEDKYFSYNITNQTFRTLQFEDKTYSYPKTKFVDNNTLYVLAQRSRTKPKLSIIRCKMKNPNY